MHELSIEVIGTPEPQKRPRTFMAKNGRAITWSPKSAWTQLVYATAVRIRPTQPLDGPLDLNIVFNLPKPKTSKNAWPIARGDWDNYAKGTCDALTRAGWWEDDCRIVIARVVKQYCMPGRKPSATIWVRQIGL